MRLEAIEIIHRRGIHLEGISDDEEVAPNPNPKPNGEQDEEIILIVLSRENVRVDVELYFYDGRLDTNGVLDLLIGVDSKCA